MSYLQHEKVPLLDSLADAVHLGQAGVLGLILLEELPGLLVGLVVVSVRLLEILGRGQPDQEQGDTAAQTVIHPHRINT